jgi:hypothetical protein
MLQLANLVPNPDTMDQWVPRPGSVQLTSFPGFNTPGFISALFVLGDIAYGMIATARNAGKDEPFAYNIATNTFETISGITNANTPTSPATTGDWTPPIIDVIGSKVVVTHPGFAGGGAGFFFGWFDISGFTDNSVTGTTHNSTLIDTLSKNVLQAGWTVGMTITGTNIPAGAFIVSIAANGLSVVISAAATDAVAGKTLTVAGGTATAPLWAAGNTNGQPLASVPVSVKQMAGRAYFAVGKAIQFSDVGSATQITNATQTLIPNNGLAVTALGQLPLSSPITGGIIQAIVVFQGVSAMQIITGDPTTNNLALNTMKVGTGTLSPLSIVSHNDGMAFASPEGMRVVNFSAVVSNPIGDGGTGITTPFIFVISPSRTCGAANAGVIRYSLQDGSDLNQPREEYWFDLTRKVFHGAHTFPADQIQPWQATFVIAPVGVPAKLFQSDPQPNINSVFTENGATMTFVFTTTLLPDNDSGAMNAIIESNIAANYPPQTVAVVTAIDDSGAVLDTVQMSGIGVPNTIWGNFTWGQAPWLGGAGTLRQRAIQWHQPIVFKQGFLQVTGTSLLGLVLGNLYVKYQELGYNNELGP